MQWPRAHYRTWIAVAILIASILLIVLAAHREFVQRQLARFGRFGTFDSAQVEKIILEAQVPKSFSSKEEMLQAVLAITVPGCGLSGNIISQPDGSTVWLESIEIFGRNKDRCLVFRELNGKLLKCDDFVYDTNQYAIVDVQRDGDQLSYLDRTGQPVPVIRLEQRAPKP